ncbi:TOMM precursor leader peptide-binding protein [Kitasatospora sp. NA04385]|uniref:TOMM precursor leader peptide-binding protein n=1 Tax=Kitasatospora sp. NA04385 TaxID=2742135 RepID=UPI001590A2C5|nr:TOMM precursor leader peptide-binding protein [Kitasatospora sp. NA04385]QKW18195.1 TOMM precursor leader peptide-binding protein [Kitasatospora sp. NA04385]
MAPYEEIADSRPRIRRDVLFTQTPEGVLFHNAHGGFGLTAKDGYRFASLIVPHLNGRHTVAEISGGFGEHHRAMLAELVGTLYSRGFARDAGPAPEGPGPLTPEAAARFGPQIEYVDHYAGDAEERFHRFRQTRVAVLGEDELARWSALSLIRNGCAAIGVRPGLAESAGFAEVEAQATELAKSGCPVTIDVLAPEDAADDRPGSGWARLDGYDVVLVTGPAGPRRTARLLEEGIPEGRLLLPAWTIGGSAVIGPLMSADRTGCWTCAALRLGSGALPSDAAELWSALAPVAPLTPGTREPGGPLAAMLGNLLGYEVFRLTTGALPAETDGRLLVQDMDSLDVTGEPLLPHPRCPRCTSDAADGPALTAADGPALTAADAPLLTAADLDEAEAAGGRAPEGDGSEAALAELDARATLVGRCAGVFADYADDGWQQTPLKLGTVRLHPAPGRPRDVTAADVHHVAGARLRALYRAAEVYVEHVVPPRTAETVDADGAVAAEGVARVRPESLTTASGLPSGAVRAWSPAASLLTGTPVLVPTAALRTFGPHNRDRAFEATSAGTGAGGTLAEAAVRGLRTALGYDALRLALRGRLTPHTVPSDAFRADAELTFLTRSARNLGLEPELLRLGGADAVLPVVLARAVDPGTGEYRWTLGSGLTVRDAAAEALRDLLGAVQLDHDPAAAAPADQGDPLIGQLDPAVLVPAVLVPEPADGSGSTGDDTGTPDWAGVLERLRAAGRDVLLAPCGPADLRAGRIEVVKVLLTDGTSDV